MVLYKRKPLNLLPPPANIEKQTELWIMPHSGEVFTDYDSYLKRYDFLNQKKFTDAVNGKSGLTFFAAAESETHSASDIEKLFPDALRDPILRKVQFSTITRIDELVSMVFDAFKNDFFPGEEVEVHDRDTGRQCEATIREKAKFEAIIGPDGKPKEAWSRYFVEAHGNKADKADGEFMVVDKQLKRGRKIFTKQNLRSFLKNCLIRDSWNGAPWLVKESIASKYRLPMEIPPHLTQGAMSLAHPAAARQAPAAFNKVNGRKGKSLTLGDFAQENSHQSTGATNGTHSASHGGKAEAAPKPPGPPPIKYPIEDLDLPPKRDGSTRPRLKFIAPEHPGENDIRSESVGMLLEVWNTLNVQCQFFHLDSFTFDDFSEAMKFSSEDLTCELFEEMHCAVLKRIVNEEGALQVTLPDMALAEDSESEEEDESGIATPVVDVPARSTRSRLSQVMAMDDKDRDSKSPSESRHRPHRAPEMLSTKGWVERLQAREFSDGGWQTIMVGLLYQLSLSPRHKAECDKILAHLAPLDEEPTQETAFERYVTLDVNKRLSALQMITMLAVSTKALRDYLEECSEAQTEIRKRKLEFQKDRKAALVQLAELDNQRKIMLPDNMPESPKAEAVDAMDVDLPGLDDTMNTAGTPNSDMDDEDEDVVSGRSLRRHNERKRKRDEDVQRREREREEKEKARMAKGNSKQSKEFTKLLDQLDKLRKKILKCESEIDECDSDLREASNHRTKVLGRDRFWNRYYWFERNGMPFAGLPDSSTFDYGYANARIWVQGPDEIERLGFIELDEAEQRIKIHQQGMSVPERKAKEEGSTSLRTADDWGFYDDPDEVKRLIGWLEDKGVREKGLKKELLLWDETIEKYMRNLKEHIKGEKKEEEEEEDAPVLRMSTRHKTYIDTDEEGLRCLKWHNNAALSEIGHIHSQPVKPKEKKSKKAAVVKEEKGVARPLNNTKTSKAEPRQTRSKR